MLKPEATPSADVLAALPIFPLPNLVLLPGMILPLNVFEPRYLDLVDHVVLGGQHIGVPLLRPGYEDDYHGSPAIEDVFGVGRLLSHIRLGDGRRIIRLEGVGRVRCLEEHASHLGFRTVRAEPLAEDLPATRERLDVLRALIERVSRAWDSDDDETLETLLSIDDPRSLTYTVAALMPSIELIVGNAIGARSLDAHAHTSFQQSCLAAEGVDARAALIIERLNLLLDRLHSHPRFRETLN